MNSRGSANRKGRPIVILASVADDVALRLPERLARPDVLVMTPADLSQPGWAYRPGRAGSELVANGQVLRSQGIAGVVTRLPWISEAELMRIAQSDRAYVASEISAFLLAWLTEVECPVVNRPGPNCLCGPFWRHERWVAEAAGAGLEVHPARRYARIDETQRAVARPCLERSTVIVVGERCFGDTDEVLSKQARSLARATGTETLTVHFSDTGTGMRFLTANPWPCLESDDVADAVLAHLVEFRRSSP
jgi:hypothetical protein